jgi:hypothetical protein
LARENFLNTLAAACQKTGGLEQAYFPLTRRNAPARR